MYYHSQYYSISELKEQNLNQIHEKNKKEREIKGVFLQQYSSNLLLSIPPYKRHPPVFQTHASLNILINLNQINQSTCI